MGKNGSSDILYFLGLKITADDDGSHEIKRHLFLGRKAMTNLDSMLKRRDSDIALLTKVYLVKVFIFLIAMYGCESWTIKVECWRIDAFALWCYRRLLRVPRTARSNQLNLKEINSDKTDIDIRLIFIRRTDAEAEAQIVWPPDVKSWIIWKDHDAGKDWRQQKKEGMTEDEMVGWPSLTQLTWVSASSGRWSAAVPEVTKCQTRLSDWTTTAKLTKGQTQKECKQKV